MSVTTNGDGVVPSGGLAGLGVWRRVVVEEVVGVVLFGRAVVLPARYLESWYGWCSRFADCMLREGVDDGMD